MQVLGFRWQSRQYRC